MLCVFFFGFSPVSPCRGNHSIIGVTTHQDTHRESTVGGITGFDKE
jgi:hypothetical protein